MERNDPQNTAEIGASERILCSAISWILALVSSLFVIFVLISTVGNMFGTKFPVFRLGEILWILLCLVPFAAVAVLSSVVIRRYSKAQLHRTALLSRRKVKSAISVILCLFAAVLIFPVCFLRIIVSAPVYSVTCSADDYLILDSYAEEALSEAKVNVFPDKIPDEAENVSYYFFSSRRFDAECEIFAEWSLNIDALEDEIDRVTSLGKASREYAKGDFTCIEFDAENIIADVLNDYTCFFAYDENSGTVRYVFCYDFDLGEIPYTDEIKW